jgi:hypothetical protein
MSTDFRALCAELLTDYEQNRFRAELAAEARAVLARWGNYPVKPDSSPAYQPEPVAPTDEDLEDLAEVMNVSGNPVPAMRRALELWGTPAIKPVAVAERLPEPDDCNAEGGCWFWHPGHKEDDFIDGWILLDPKWAGSRRDSDDWLIYTHWLPHHAIPTPETND